MSEEVVIIAILEPAPGKLERLKELLKENAEWVKEHEPHTLQYSVFESGSDENHKISIYERYANKAAMEKHESSEKFKATMGALMGEEMIAGSPAFAHGKDFAGFKR